MARRQAHTPDDVIFSFNAFKKYSPQLAAYYRHVVKVEKTGDRELTFAFDLPGNRELPQIVGQLLVLPQHWWEDTDANGNKRDIGSTTLESAARQRRLSRQGLFARAQIVYERVNDYWADQPSASVSVATISTNCVTNTFATRRSRSKRSKQHTVDWRTENSAKNWATAYDFPAANDKRVILEEFPVNNYGVMQAFAFNVRRAKFQDPRVRLAFNSRVRF